MILFRDRSFIRYAKVSGKLTFLIPLLRTRTCAYQGVINVSFFSENFAYVLNEWFLGTSSQLFVSMRMRQESRIKALQKHWKGNTSVFSNKKNSRHFENFLVSLIFNDIFQVFPDPAIPWTMKITTRLSGCMKTLAFLMSVSFITII